MILSVFLLLNIQVNHFLLFQFYVKVNTNSYKVAALRVINEEKHLCSFDTREIVRNYKKMFQRKEDVKDILRLRQQNVYVKKTGFHCS